jgi:hypothetical protein
MNEWILRGRERVLRTLDEGKIYSLFATQACAVDDRDCRSLIVEHNTRDLVCIAYTPVQTPNYIRSLFSPGCLLQMQSRSEFENVPLSPSVFCDRGPRAKSFFPLLLIQSDAIVYPRDRRGPTTRAFLHCHRR